MSNPPPFRRRLGIGIAGLAVAAGAATVLTAPSPSANAAVEAITISGSDFKVGGTYSLHADLGGASVGLLIYWSDNGEDFSGPKVPWPVGEASIDWSPKSAGQHILTASQGGSTKSLVVTVGGNSTVPPTTTAPPTTTVPPTTQPPTTTPPPTTTVAPTTTAPTTEPPTTAPPTTAPPTTTAGNGGTGSADGLPNLFGSS